MCSSASANGKGVGSSPGGGSMSVQTIVLMLDDPDSRLASKAFSRLKLQLGGSSNNPEGWCRKNAPSLVEPVQ